MTQLLSRAAPAPAEVRPISAPPDHEGFGANETAANIWEIQEALCTPGTPEYATFREVVPETPVVIVPDEALPEDVRGSRYRIVLKREYELPGGSYKLRGATAALAEEKRIRPYLTTAVAATRGNHGNAVARAAFALGYERAEVYCPEDTSLVKRYGMEQNGATTHLAPTLNECVRQGRRHGTQPGAVFIHPYDNPTVVAGQGTLAGELARQFAELGIAPEQADIFVGAGGGGVLSGTAVAASKLLPGARMHGVQMEGSHGLVAFHRGEAFDMEEFTTACDGAAVPGPGEIAKAVVADAALVHGAHKVRKGDIGEAMAVASRVHEVPEPAGALGLAGVLAYMREHPLGPDDPPRTLVAVITGVNATLPKVQEFLAAAYQDGRLTLAEVTTVNGQAYAERPATGLDELLMQRSAVAAAGSAAARGTVLSGTFPRT